MNTIENNKKIAEFMGHRYDDNRNSHSSSDYYYEDSELEYNTSWDWLMEVVERIEGIEYKEDLFYDVIIGGFLECTIQDREGNIIIETTIGHGKIQAVYKAVIAFIDWWEKQNSYEHNREQ